jgi:hypothetical protein
VSRQIRLFGQSNADKIGSKKAGRALQSLPAFFLAIAFLSTFTSR